MINETIYNYIKTLSPEEFKHQILNQSFADKCIKTSLSHKFARAIK